MAFCLWYYCYKHFLKFYQKNFARKIALQTNENVRKLDKLERQKYRIKT